MLISVIAVLFAIVGALVYALSSNPKVSELGRLCFLAAMIGLMVHYAGVSVRVG